MVRDSGSRRTLLATARSLFGRRKPMNGKYMLGWKTLYDAQTISIGIASNTYGLGTTGVS
jgi:hypothetical protein